jgi:hypothetical protein
MGVVIENLNKATLEAGLTANQLRTDTELRLRKAGIPIDEESTMTSYLYVRVTGLKVLEYPAYAFSIEVDLRQPIQLQRNAGIKTIGVTWTDGSLTVADTGAVDHVRDKVGDLMRSCQIVWVRHEVALIE